jgi:hypothetical protein
MGKSNLRLDFSPSVVTDDQPVVCIIRRPGDGLPSRGVEYRLKDRLKQLLAEIVPDRLEEQSRRIAACPVDDVLAVRELTPRELEAFSSTPSPGRH